MPPIERVGGRAETMQRLRERKVVHALMVSHLSWGGILATFRDSGVHLVIIEMEHNHFSWADVDDLVRSANAYDVACLVRIADSSYGNISKALDLGADGILVPRIQSADELAAVADAMRLPPRGKKGVGGRDFAVADLDSKLANYNDEKLLFIQVENRAALENLPALLATREIQGVIVGPFDLSVGLGTPRDFGSDVFVNAVERVVRVCGEAGVSVGMFLGDKGEVQHWAGRGMNILWTGSDLSLLNEGISAAASLVRQLGTA